MTNAPRAIRRLFQSGYLTRCTSVNLLNVRAVQQVACELISHYYVVTICIRMRGNTDRTDCLLRIRGNLDFEVNLRLSINR